MTLNELSIKILRYLLDRGDSGASDYDIVTAVEDGEWNAPLSTVNTLTRDGLIQFDTLFPKEGELTIYTITDKGKQVLAEQKPS